MVAGLTAPVYLYTGSDIELWRIGTLTYEAPPGVIVLYCIATQEAQIVLQCVIRTPDDRLKLADIPATDFNV
jgi:hypothetical protein